MSVFIVARSVSDSVDPSVQDYLRNGGRAISRRL
jgi:hypothetical protein